MVEGYTGRPGGGKTCSMIARAWQAKQKGRPVFSNIPLIDRRKKKRSAYWGFGKKSTGTTDPRTYGKPWCDGMVRKLDDVLQLDNALVLLDEVHMWCPSTSWQAMPFEVRQYLAQQRKIGIDLWWTAQNNARVFNVIRELTANVWNCCRYGMVSVLTGQDPESKEPLGRKYVFLGPDIWQLYDTEFMVGDATGKVEGRYGFNARYHKNDGSAAALDQGGIPSRRVVWERTEQYGIVQLRKVLRETAETEVPTPIGGGFSVSADGEDLCRLAYNDTLARAQQA